MSDFAASTEPTLSTSPYLARNVASLVNWAPWGQAALDRAARENKPVLVQVGDFRSRACRAMERDVFTDAACAAFMNAHFVCVLVDREAAPELDTWFVAAALTLNGNADWPLTVFCTPEPVAPFFVSAALSAADQSGRLGFRSLLIRIQELWHSDSAKLFQQASELAERLSAGAAAPAPKAVTATLLDRAAQGLIAAFDKEHAGFGLAPKQPQCELLHFLLRRHHAEPNLELLKIITQSLDVVKNSALRDALEGGFFSYCTDRDWQLPRFEKTLANNAQLARLYLEAFQLTQNFEYQKIAFETLDFVLAQLEAPGGGFFAAITSDLNSPEGAYYLFNARELRSVLEPEETRVFCTYYGVSDTNAVPVESAMPGAAALSSAALGGLSAHAEGAALSTRRDKKSVAKDLGLSLEEFETLLSRAQDKALFLRKQRALQLRVCDRRTFTAWNALMVSALSEASWVALDDASTSPQTLRSQRASVYLAAAERAADAWLTEPLRREVFEGQPGGEATLEDYACVTAALLDLHELTGSRRYLVQAEHLGQALADGFFDRARGVFQLTRLPSEPWQTQLRPLYHDTTNATRPKPGAQAARALYRLSLHSGQSELRRHAEAVVRTYAAALERTPQHHPSTLVLAHDLLAPTIELLFKAQDVAEVTALQKEVGQRYLPQRVVRWALPGQTSFEPLASEPSLGAALYIGINSQAQAATFDAAITTAQTARRALEAAQTSAQTARAERLTPPAVPGFATREGSQRYLTRHAVHPSAQRELGDVRVSRVGFGMQRVSDANPKHREALRLALQNGCNLIETAPAYGAGASMRAAFNVLTELFESGGVKRDEVCIVAKLGIVTQSTTAADVLTPAALQKQLDETLATLNLETLDVCLLHNPEQLLPAISTVALLDRLVGAFSWLEQARQAGRIREYGVASSVLNRVSSPVSLELVERARLASGVPQGRVVSLPYNVFEREAVTEAVLSRATELGYSVLSQRPLHAVRDGQINRLAMPRPVASGPSFEETQREVAKLEHEFRSQLGAVLRAVPGIDLPVDRFFLWSERIQGNAFPDRERWDEFEQNVLAKQLPGLLGAMEASFKPTQLAALWQSWRERYTQTMEALVVAARRESGERTTARNTPVFLKLREHAPKALQHASLAQFALWFASSTEGVSSTLVGMRHPDYVVETTATLRWPESSAPDEWEDADSL